MSPPSNRAATGAAVRTLIVRPAVDLQPRTLRSKNSSAESPFKDPTNRYTETYWPTGDGKRFLVLETEQTGQAARSRWL